MNNDKLTYTLQYPYPNDTILEFGTDTMSISEYIKLLLFQCNGELSTKCYGDTSVVFTSIDDARFFFSEFHEKLAPRGFRNIPDDNIEFLTPNDWPENYERNN